MYGLFLDGQTRKATINEVQGLHGKLEFSFRPMTFDDVERCEAALLGFGVSETQKKTAFVRGVIAKHVTDWKTDRPVSLDSISMLHPRIVNRLYLIVTGRDPGDGPFDGGKADEDEYVRQIMELQAGKTPGQVFEETAVKN